MTPKRSGARERPTRREPPKNADDPRGLWAAVQDYLQTRRASGYSMKAPESALYLFTKWCEERSVLHATEVTRPILERYQRHLFHLCQKNGKPLAFQTQARRVLPLLVFFQWLAKRNHILYNPGSEIEVPRYEKKVPPVMTVAEAEKVLSVADVNTAVGIRDRAMMETLYSTGIRRMELARLEVYDVDLDDRTVKVRQGKGRKDRLVPIGQRALGWIDKYLFEIRPEIVMQPDPRTLFLTVDGEPFSPNHLGNLIRGYVERAEIHKEGACHLFRHTMATAMLENGADIRFVQAMLGHKAITTTEIYTHVAIRKLKEVHENTHPSAKLGRHRPTMVDSLGADTSATQIIAAKTELLSTLAAEAESEGGKDESPLFDGLAPDQPRRYP
jgi:integrase/recombinase XerD